MKYMYPWSEARHIVRDYDPIETLQANWMEL